MVRRSGHIEIMPDEETELMLHDEILLCGTESESRYTKWQTNNIELLENNLFENQHTIPLLKWLNRKEESRLAARKAAEASAINLIDQDNQDDNSEDSSEPEEAVEKK